MSTGENIRLIARASLDLWSVSDFSPFFAHGADKLVSKIMLHLAQRLEKLFLIKREPESEVF